MKERNEVMGARESGGSIRDKAEIGMSVSLGLDLKKMFFFEENLWFFLKGVLEEKRREEICKIF